MLRRLRGRIDNLKKLGQNRLELLQEDVNENSRRNSLVNITTKLDAELEKSSILSKLSVQSTQVSSQHTSTNNKGKKKKGKKDDESLFSDSKESRKVMNQMKRERNLVASTGAYLARTVYDLNIEFPWVSPNEDQMDDASDAEKAVIEYKRFDDVKLPITVRWPSYSLRSKLASNSDGKMNIDLFLRYAVDMTHFSIGEGVMTRLFRTQALQEYFVILFWFIQVRFFQPKTPLECESCMLGLLRLLYVDLLEEVNLLTKYPYEKDTIFKYLPITLSNAIFYSFYYSFPASQHLFTEYFHKTLYLQIVKLLFGTELSISSINVVWYEAFPENSRYHEFITNNKNKILSTYDDDDILPGISKTIEIDENIPIALAYNKYNFYKMQATRERSSNGQTIDYQLLKCDNSPETDMNATETKISPNTSKIETLIDATAAMSMNGNSTDNVTSGSSMEGILASDMEDYENNNYLPTSNELNVDNIDDFTIGKNMALLGTNNSVIEDKKKLFNKSNKSTSQSSQNLNTTKQSASLLKSSNSSSMLNLPASWKALELVAGTYLEPPRTLTATSSSARSLSHMRPGSSISGNNTARDDAAAPVSNDTGTLRKKVLSKPPRTFIDSTQLSPLLHANFSPYGAEGDEMSRSCKPRPVFIAKTEPTEFCIVGGMDTFKDTISDIPFARYDELSYNVDMSKKHFNDIRKQTLKEKRKILRHLENQYIYNQKERTRKLLREKIAAEAAARAATPLITTSKQPPMSIEDKRRKMKTTVQLSNLLSSLDTTLNSSLNQSSMLTGTNTSGFLSNACNTERGNEGANLKAPLPPISSRNRNNSADNNKSRGSSSSSSRSVNAITVSSSKSGTGSYDDEDANPANMTGVDLILNEKKLKEFLREMVKKDEIEYLYNDEQDF